MDDRTPTREMPPEEHDALSRPTLPAVDGPVHAVDALGRRCEELEAELTEVKAAQPPDCAACTDAFVARVAAGNKDRRALEDRCEELEKALRWALTEHCCDTPPDTACALCRQLDSCRAAWALLGRTP